MIDLSSVCTECGGYDNQPILKLLSDGCLTIVDGKNTDGDFCLNDFAFPVDGHTCVSLNVEMSGGELTIFDNHFGAVSPANIVEVGKLYARGVLIRLIYPLTDDNGESLTLANKSARIYIENAATLESAEYPLYDFFSIFTNPKSSNIEDLINKIKIINPNSLYNIRVSALVLFGKAE